MARLPPAKDIPLREPIDWTSRKAFERRVVLGRRAFGRFSISLAQCRGKKTEVPRDWFIVNCYAFDTSSVVATTYYQKRFHQFANAKLVFNNDALTLCDALARVLPIQWGDQPTEQTHAHDDKSAGAG